ncbi:phytanoyl-CoA dioxygenase family protein [Paenibacillus sp. TAB 01]|uniref:phytanoyl-CoA dioxygenase family protein n=1 Tax=Paenibacillus sp. TAB 01 TaxID=3368988 RepID=UPI003751EC15
MLTLDQLEAFYKDGFIKGSVVLREQEVDRLREELDRVMNGETVKKPVLNRNLLDGSPEYGMSISSKETVVQIVNIWMASDLFLQHAANRTLCEEAAQLCRTDTLRIWHDQIQYKPPVTGEADRLAPGPSRLAYYSACRPGQRLGRVG